MDLRDIFHSFFGFNHKDDDFFFNRDSFFDKDQNKSHFSDDFNIEINRDFDDMFQNFGHLFNILNHFSTFNNKNFIEFNDSNEWQELDSGAERKNPRDLMLKDSQNEKKDFDYDQTVRKNGLNSLFDKKPDNDLDVIKSPTEPKVIKKSYFYRSSFNNGRMEEQKITRDEFGNEETSITQRIGDKSFTKVIKKNNNNVVEENEVLSNLSENELNDFMRQWNRNQVIDNSRSMLKIEENKPNERENSLIKRLFSFPFRLFGEK